MAPYPGTTMPGLFLFQERGVREIDLFDCRTYLDPKARQERPRLVPPDGAEYFSALLSGKPRRVPDFCYTNFMPLELSTICIAH
jgi:hypothetical protein